MENVSVPVQLFQMTMEYLRFRPWAEVAELLEAYKPVISAHNEMVAEAKKAEKPPEAC